MVIGPRRSGEATDDERANGERDQISADPSLFHDQSLPFFL